jgi:hypothetical protein
MREFIAFLGSVLLFVALLVGGIVWTVNSLSLPASLAKIEQLRSDAAATDPIRAEDVIGQVTQWNQTIVSNQTFNHTWYFGWAIPDEWDRVQLIAVPR